MKRFKETFDFSLKDAEFIAGVGCVLLFMAAGAGVLQMLIGSGTVSSDEQHPVRE